MLDKVHIIFLPQVGWLGGKEVDFHLWGSKSIPKMTWVVANIGMLIEYSIPM
jgi:hypothetical protein